MDYSPHLEINSQPLLVISTDSDNSSIIPRSLSTLRSLLSTIGAALALFDAEGTQPPSYNADEEANALEVELSDDTRPPNYWESNIQSKVMEIVFPGNRVGRDVGDPQGTARAPTKTVVYLNQLINKDVYRVEFHYE